MLEGDAMQIVVNAGKVKERNRSNFGQIVDDIRSVLDTLQFWQVCHVKAREANGVARRLAKVAVQQGVDQAWMEVILGFICDNVMLE
jgi:hypothetical protein